jgi:hypothetical protein
MSNYLTLLLFSLYSNIDSKSILYFFELMKRLSDTESTNSKLSKIFLADTEKAV